MKEREKKKQIAKISIFITSIFVIFISFAYAFINQTLTGTKRQVIRAGNLELELKEGDTITLENALPMYDEVGMIQKEFAFQLINKTEQNTAYVLKLKDVTEESKDKLDISHIKYGFIKDDNQTIDNLSNLVENTLDTGTIRGKQTIKYSLRLWIDSSVEDETLIKDKILSYKIEVEATLSTEEEVIPMPVSQRAFAEENLGENCKTYDDGVNTFLVGQCNQNYVWYSGKLWRVVLKNNETGAVKMITDNGITGISYNPQNQPDFENSYVDQWLNQEFLPTLHDYENYLVENSTWDATLDDPNIPTRPTGTTSVQRTVGLLNAYEYYTTFNNSDGFATYSTGYLNNGTKWLFITLDKAGTVIRCANSDGSLKWDGVENNNVVRPVVNLQSNIFTALGNGTIDKPYQIEGDSKETINGTTLLSTRYSGEYITFNNELYRIVDVENNLTKITAVEKPAELLSNTFGNNSIFSDSSSIKMDLEIYYQNNVRQPYKSMIAENQTWYVGPTSLGESYKKSICEKVDSTISIKECTKRTPTTATMGLPRIGEMFTSQITRNKKESSWALGWSGAFTHFITTDGAVGNNSPSKNHGARPSLYLKSNVTIAADNTGDGTYEHPYSIEQLDFSINNSSEYTTTANVTLRISGNVAYQMCISNTENCTNYEPFSETKEWQLIPGDGEKTVYVYFRRDGNIKKFNQTIILDATSPADNNIEISSSDGVSRTLTLSSIGADYMCFSNSSPEVNDCSNWKNYATTAKWGLTLGDGEKTVYAFFKDKAGNIGSASTTTICENCNEVLEDFEDEDYNITITGSTDYPWVVQNGKFTSSNKGKGGSSSISTIRFTPIVDSKLSFDYGVSSESNYDKLTITLTPEGGTEKKLANAISGVNTGKITDEPLTAGTTYTLTLTYSKDSGGDKNDDMAYIDNLLIAP